MILDNGKRMVTNKIRVKKITLTRAEGPAEECHIEKVALNYADANAVLYEWSDSVDKETGCDKCDFVVTFQDESIYQGVYDLKHWSKYQSEGEQIDLNERIRNHCLFTAGIEKPAYMTEEKWQMALKLTEKNREVCQDFLDHYDI